MTIKTRAGRIELSNVGELKAKRGVTVRFIYNIDEHIYTENGHIKYHPYVR